MIKIIIIKDLVKREKEFPKLTVFVIVFLSGFITVVISSVFMFGGILLSSVVSLLVGGIISIGIAQLSCSIIKGKGEDLSIAFEILTHKEIIKKVSIAALSILIIWIGFLLLIVPGIILSYGLGIVPFMLVDEDYESLSVIETLKKSWELMKNNKVKMFLLQLRYFLVWYAGLAIFSLIVIFSVIAIADSINSTVMFELLLLSLFIIPLLIGFSILISYISSKYYIALALFYEQVKEQKTSLLEDKNSLQIEEI